MWQIYGEKDCTLTRGGLVSDSVVTTNGKKSAEVIVPPDGGKDGIIVGFEFTKQTVSDKDCGKYIQPRKG